MPRGSKRLELHYFHLQAVHRWAILAPVPCRSRWRPSIAVTRRLGRGEEKLVRKASLGTSWPRHRGGLARRAPRDPGRGRVADGGGGGKDVRAASGGAVALALISAAGLLLKERRRLLQVQDPTTSNRACWCVQAPTSAVWVKCAAGNKCEMHGSSARHATAAKHCLSVRAACTQSLIHGRPGGAAARGMERAAPGRARQRRARESPPDGGRAPRPPDQSFCGGLCRTRRLSSRAA